MSTNKSFFVLKVKAIPARYGLSKNIQALLQCLDSYHTGSIDISELGRMVRLSPRRRAAVANTITKCANILKKDPSEINNCVDVIDMCTEILHIADGHPSTKDFPFMKLPMEIRVRILELMIDDTYTERTVVAAGKLSSCRCPRFDRDHVFQTPQMKSLLNGVGQALGEEFYGIFFRKKSFRFRCACELLLHLNQNASFTRNVRHIVVHWCGPESAHAFKALRRCSRLESLSINISKSTQVYLNERANVMKRHFPIPYRQFRMPDALGMDELLEIRGLQNVQVGHSQPKNISNAGEVERACLWELLSSELTLPRPDDPSTY